jgi:RNA polymerase sigma-B factor
MTVLTLASASPAPKLPYTKARNPDRAAAQAAERQLLLRYHRWGDLAAREELVERFLPLARDLALRYTYTDEPFDDLLQVASLGLIKAIDRFSPDHGSKFTSYAAPTILGELKRHFRDKGWALHMPRDLQERTLAVSRETEALSKRLGRSPKPREVAQALGCSVEQVLEAQEAAASYEAASLDAPTAREDDESAPLVDMMGTDDSAYELVEDRDAIAAPGRRCRRWSARWSRCASCPTSPSARLASGSATRRCTSRASSGAPSTASRVPRRPHREAIHA